ncbi:hypothetical protein [Mucilaginibacter arboris]|nr:hypothetical protein [Mucilaginibacter arboris]
MSVAKLRTKYLLYAALNQDKFMLSNQSIIITIITTTGNISEEG